VERAGEGDGPGPADARASSHTLDAAGKGNDPKTRLGQSEHRPLGCPDQVTEERQLKTARHARSVHCRECRNRQVF
jgi:hypothetical protein